MKKRKTSPTGPRPRAARQASSRSHGTKPASARDSSVRAHRSKSPQKTATLREQADLLQLTHDTLCVIARNLDDAITFWNRGAEEQYGWTASEALGQVTHILLQTQFPQPLEEIHSQLLRSGRWEGELAHTRRDGTRIIVASRWALQSDARGRPVAILEINNDVTDRKRAEDQIRQLNEELERRVAERTAKLEAANGQLEELNVQLEEEIAERQAEILARVQAEERARHLASFPELNPNPVIEVDAYGKITFANPATQKVLEKLGVDPGNVHTLLPTDMDGILTHWDKKTTASYYQEIVVNNKVFGETITLIPQFTVARVYAYDITERKRAEEAVRESEERFRTLVEALPQIIGIADAQGKSVYFNRRWIEYTRLEVGADADRVKLVHPDDVQRVAQIRQEAMRTGSGIFQGEYRLRRHDGEYRWFLVRTILMRESPGGVARWITSATDIHDLKQAQESILKLNQELEQRAHDLEKANEELELANEELRVTNEDLAKEIVERRRAEESLREATHALRVSEERFRFALANSPIIVANVDRQLRYTWVYNPVAGFKVEDVLGKTVGLSTDPEAKEHILTLLQDVVTQGTPAQWETASRTTAGEKFFESHAEPLRDAQGEITGAALLSIDITERKRTEERLAFQANILANITDVVYSTDEQFRLTSWNHAAERLYGWKEEEVLGKNVVEVVGSKFDPEMRTRLTRELMQRESVTAEIEHRTRSGKAIFLESVTMLLRDAGGKATGFVSVNRDITERKRAEEKLNEQAFMLSNVSDAVICADIRNQITYWNQGAERMYGYGEAEALGQTVGALLRVEYGPNERERIVNELTGTGVTNLLARARHKDGTEVIADIVATRVTDSQGSTIGTVVIHRDVTERQRTQELSYALNALNAVIHSTLDLDEIMQRAMHEAARALGCDTAAISLRQGDRWLVRYVHGFPKEVIGAEMNDDQERHAVLAIQTKKPVAVDDAFSDERVNREHMRKWGVRSVLVVPLIVKDEAIGVIFFNYQQSPFTFRDAHIDFGIQLAASLSLALENARLFENLEKELAQRKLAEESLQEALHSLREAMHRIQKLNRELEQRAQDLEMASEELRVTNDELHLANEKLRVANESLEASLAQEQATRVALQATNKELEAFTYTVAHDLRAPLNLIEQFAHMVLDDYGQQLAEPGQHLVRLIRENAVAVNRLAEDLLTLSRLTQQSLAKRTVSMQELVQQALAELYPEGIPVGQDAQVGRQVEIAVGELPPAQVDPVLLKRVWVNLISNALKFTRPREVARIEIGSLQEQNQTIYFVKDNGTGFDMAHSDRLFRAFQRLHHPEDFEGNGLGLAIVERVIRRHGGRVWADAEVDKGATFNFTLE